MIQCPGCRRHVRASEATCPFCRRAGLPADGVVGALGAAVCTVVLAACYGTGDFAGKASGDTADSVPIEFPRVTSYDVECDAANDVARYRAFTSIEPFAGVVFQQDTSSPGPGQLAEEHDLLPNDLGDAVERELVPDVQSPTRNESTAFSCVTDQLTRQDRVTFAFGLVDETGALVDCLAGGHDPRGLVDGTYQGLAAVEPSFPLSLCRIPEGTP